MTKLPLARFECKHVERKFRVVHTEKGHTVYRNMCDACYSQVVKLGNEQQGSKEEVGQTV